jgi:NitT/TauT family transport system ATP-binding protein
MITVDSACLGFSHGGATLPVLHDISFAVAECDSCAVIGPSGCGKTSLLFLLAGLLRPDRGVVEVVGQEQSGMILQNYGLFPWKTVAENVGLGLVLRGAARKTVAATVERLLGEMGLSGFGGHFPGQLSGGMQQRVAMARALAVEPRILFMDEPLSSLDALTRERLQNLIAEVWLGKRITMVLVTHSIEEAVFLGRRIVVLGGRPGRVLRLVDNPEAGGSDYRDSDVFFHRCVLLRQILKGEGDGPET